MKLLRVNIGLEHERVIFNRKGQVAHVKGADQRSLPHDTMSCLAETRGHFSYDSGDAVARFLDRQKQVDELYKQRRLVLKHGEHKITKAMSEAAYEEDHTKAPVEHFDEDGATYRGGGLHIHFSIMDNSSWVTSSMFRNYLFAEFAAARLDGCLKDHIKGRSAYRTPGSVEIKQWGFEYRSLFWGGDPAVLVYLATSAKNVVAQLTGELLHLAGQLHEPLWDAHKEHMDNNRELLAGGVFIK